MDKGLVADIQRASFHDGDGIRTTVFMKGCPLSCLWCHNPEAISFEKQELFYPEKCIGCNMCHKGCYSGAKVICGKEMTPEEVFAEIKLDAPYYTGGGGVTFSGGEPMAQKKFVKEVISLCKKENISCAMETSLILYDEEIFKSLDFIMADLKIWDDDIHKEYTGVSNKPILETLAKLLKSDVSIWVRVPIVPGVNDTEEEMKNVKAFFDINGYPEKIELLPYHAMGEHKYEALGKATPKFDVPNKEKIEKLKNIVVPH